MVSVPSVTTTSSSTLLANVCRPVLLDSGLIAESLTPLLIKVTGVVLVLLVTKVPTLVHHVPDQNSLIVPAVMTAGSKTVQTAASNVIPSVLFVLDLLIANVKLVLLVCTSINQETQEPVLLLAQMASTDLKMSTQLVKDGKTLSTL